jgi:hypothetical protein
LQGERTVIGARAGAGIQLGGDPAVAPEHAELGADAGEFAVSPLGGAVSVEGAAISGRHVLSDGETIQIGAGLFVFKSASAGNLVARSGPGAPAARPSRRRRVG